MRNRTSKSSLFLMELIIAILFFFFFSGMCMQIFVKAHLITKQTNREQNAVVASDSVIAALKNASGDLNQVASLFEGEIENEQVTIWLNESFQITSSNQSMYYIAVTREDVDQYMITVREQNSEKQILKQSIFCHEPLGE
mgnify:FL=1